MPVYISVTIGAWEEEHIAATVEDGALIFDFLTTSPEQGDVESRFRMTFVEWKALKSCVDAMIKATKEEDA